MPGFWDVNGPGIGNLETTLDVLWAASVSCASRLTFVDDGSHPLLLSLSPLVLSLSSGRPDAQLFTLWAIALHCGFSLDCHRVLCHAQRRCLKAAKISFNGRRRGAMMVEKRAVSSTVSGFCLHLNLGLKQNIDLRCMRGESRSKCLA